MIPMRAQRSRMLRDTWAVNAVIRKFHVEMKTVLEIGVKVIHVKSCSKKIYLFIYPETLSESEF